MNDYLGEFIGTAILILFGGGVVASVVLNRSKAAGGGWIVITMAWGFAVMLAVFVVGQFSGAHINPAVSIGLAMSGLFPWIKVPGYILSQLGGAMLGAYLVSLHFKPHFRATDDKFACRDVFCTSPAIKNYPYNLVSEVIGTAILMYCLLAFGLNEMGDGLSPIVVGFLIMAIGMSLGATTGYAINPARDLGPRIVFALQHRSIKGIGGWDYAFVPIIGPIIGTLIGTSLFALSFNPMGNSMSKMTLTDALIGLGCGVILLIVTLIYANKKMKTLNAQNAETRA